MAEVALLGRPTGTHHTSSPTRTSSRKEPAHRWCSPTARAAVSVDTVAACGGIRVPTVVFVAGHDRIVLFTPAEASVWIDDIREFLRIHQL